MTELVIAPLVIYLMVDKTFYVGVTQRDYSFYIFFFVIFFSLILGKLQLENDRGNAKFFAGINNEIYRDKKKN